MQEGNGIGNRLVHYQGFSGILDETELTICDNSESCVQSCEATESLKAEKVERGRTVKKQADIMSLEAIVKLLEEQGKSFRAEFERVDRRLTKFEEIAAGIHDSEPEQGASAQGVITSTPLRGGSHRLSIRPKEYIDIPVFDGVKQKDFSAWARGIQNKRLYYDWSDKEAMDFAYSRIEGYPLEIIGAHIGARLPTLKWEQFVEEMSPLFPGEPRGEDLYLEAKAYKQKASQTVSEYIREKTRLLVLSCPKMPDVVRKF